jgi:uncharacterized protein (TIGR02453 family)
MFQGFPQKGMEFFMAIRFNNNREFFLANHGWYEEGVRTPARELAAAMAEMVQEIDPTLETRPEKVVSRINRDVRFTNDKSPYRDYIWLAFRRPGADRATTMGMYFDISDQGASYGMGFYNENRPLMNALRRRILTEPEKVLEKTNSALDEFTLHANAFRRMNIPEDVPEPLKAWYTLKGFYVEREVNDFDLIHSAGLADEIKRGFGHLKPLYQYIASLTPEEDMTDPTKYGRAPDA